MAEIGHIELLPIHSFDKNDPVVVWNQDSTIGWVDEEKREVTLNTAVITPNKQYSETVFPFSRVFQRTFVVNDKKYLVNPSKI